MGRRRLAYPCVSILTRLCFRMEGMTELVNGTFIEDLSTLLSSCAEGKNRETFFEIDKEFESMMADVKSNVVVTVDSQVPSVYAGFSSSGSHTQTCACKIRGSSRMDKGRGPYCCLVKR